MKNLITSIALLAGLSSTAYAHPLSPHDGLAAIYHQLLGIHHLPVTVLLIVIGIALFYGIRRRAD